MPESCPAEETLSQHPTHFHTTGNILIQAHTVLFRVHQDVLCQHSEVFKDMFDLAQSENAETFSAIPSDNSGRIVLYDNPDILALLLDFFYKRRIDYKNTKHCLHLAQLAHKYDISNLVATCSAEITYQLPIDHTPDSYETISKYREDLTLIPLALSTAKLVGIPQIVPWALYMLSVQADSDYNLFGQSERDLLLVQSYSESIRKIRDMLPMLIEWWDEVVDDFTGGDCGADGWDCARGRQYVMEYGDMDDSVLRVKAGEKDPIRRIWEVDTGPIDFCASCENDWSDCTVDFMENAFKDIEKAAHTS